MPDMLVCPVLVGRARELEQADRALEAMRAGAGVLVAVSGEAGVGKSRVVGAISERAGEAGVRVVSGSCFEHLQTVPYAPIAEALRELVGAEDAALPEVLRPLVPELADGAATRDEWSAPERHRLAHAFVGLLERRLPLVLVVEDLHWVDAATLELLPMLARRAAGRALLTLATFRSDELGHRDDLVAALAELSRKRLVEDIAIGGLDSPGVEEMLRATFGVRGAISAEFVAAVHARTEGNPLFIEELLRTLVETGGVFRDGALWDRKALVELEVPPTIEEAILRRVGTLPDSAQSLLRLAAVLGQRFSFDAIREFAGLSDEQVLAALRSLVDEHLVHEDAATGGLRFHHALTRDAVYGRMLVGERRLLHARAAAALEALHADRLDQHAAELAFHCALAGDEQRMRSFALRAGAHAERLGAMADAWHHYDAALSATSLPGERAAVLAKLGRVDFALGEIARSIGELEEAAALYATAAEPHARARVLLDLSNSVLMNGDRARALELRMTVLEELDPHVDCAELAAAYRSLGHLHMLGAASAVAIDWSNRAIELGRRVGAEETVAAAMIDRGSALAMSENLEQAVADLRAGIASAREHGWAPEAARGYQNLGHSLILHCRYADAAAALEEGLRYALESGIEFNRVLCQAHLGDCALLTGDWAAAEQHYGAVRAIAEERDSRKYLLTATETLGTLRADQGRWREAAELRDVLEPLALERDELQHVAPLRMLSARIAEAEGRPQDARRELEAVHDYWRERSDDAVFVAPSLALACRLAAQAGDLDCARTLQEDVAAAVGRTPSPAPAILLRSAEGHLAMAAGDVAGAAEAFEAESLAWQRIGRPFDAAIALRHLGEARAAAGDRMRAQDALARAREAFVTLGAEHERKLADGALRRAGGTVPRGPRATTRAAPGGLTTRELEVARLVADGMTNAGIAGALVISEKTAAGHVGRVLGKLGFSSRAQIARWVTEQRQVSEPSQDG